VLTRPRSRPCPGRSRPFCRACRERLIAPDETAPVGLVRMAERRPSAESGEPTRVASCVGAAVHEVLQSVRSEAEGVRSEFERFKTQVDAEKAKFEVERVLLLLSSSSSVAGTSSGSAA
jgi:hypothetical protein